VLEVHSASAGRINDLHKPQSISVQKLCSLISPYDGCQLLPAVAIESSVVSDRRLKDVKEVAMQEPTDSYICAYCRTRFRSSVSKAAHESNACRSRPDVVTAKKARETKRPVASHDDGTIGNWIIKDNDIWMCTKRICMLEYAVRDVGPDEMIIEHLTGGRGQGADVRLMFKDGEWKRKFPKISTFQQQ
jgi:hypothetical protein